MTPPRPREQRLPPGFLVGSATAAHQVEGDNVASDWWEWENAPGSPCAEPSGAACDHWHRFEEDLDLLAGAGLRCYRFSVEWARVEPARGAYSPAALQHYRRVVDACLARDVVPIVTLHHFTLPRWFAAQGGWTSPGSPDCFADFVREVATALGEAVSIYCTLNEINMIPPETYLWQGFPPGGPADEHAAALATEHVLAAHASARRVLREVSPWARCGMSLALAELVGEPAHVAAVRKQLLSPYLAAAATDDFLGVQAYTRVWVDEQGPGQPPAGSRVTQMGWEYRPEALEAVLRDTWESTGGQQLLVTENGIATADDAERIAYARTALRGVLSCLADGIDIGAYLHWSLLDNFEWRHGYEPTFGLIAVDRKTLVRRPKPSLAWLGQVARTGVVG